MALCKMINVPGKGGQCLFLQNISDIPPIGDSYQVSPGLFIDKMSYWLLQEPKNKAFKAVDTGRKTVSNYRIYALEPFRTESSIIQEGKYEDPVVLGEGSYGKVIKFHGGVVRKDTKNPELRYGIPKDVITEIAMYSLLRKIACLPSLFEFGLDSPDFNLVMKGGVKTLHEAIREDNFSFEQQRIIMFRIAQCLRAIASQGVINADLKPRNMIMTENGSVQIIDWGLAKLDRTNGQIRQKSSKIQTMWYKAPEILVADTIIVYSNKVDIFSLGLIFIEIVTKSVAVPGADLFSQINGILNLLTNIDHVAISSLILAQQQMELLVMGGNERYSIRRNLTRKYPEFPAEFIDLLAGMLSISPEHRLSYDQIVTHPFFEPLQDRIPNQPRFIGNMPVWRWEELVENYAKNNILITARFLLFEWMANLSVSNEYGAVFSPYTLCLAYQITDLFFGNTTRIGVKYLQLVGCSAMSIANKLNDVFTLKISEWITATTGIYTAKEFIDMEAHIITVLQGHVAIPTMYEYIKYFSPNTIPEKADKEKIVLHFLNVYSGSTIKLKNIGNTPKEVLTKMSQIGVSVYERPFITHFGLPPIREEEVRIPEPKIVVSPPVEKFSRSETFPAHALREEGDKVKSV